MAKRELSSTLKNLKFMQRAALREEQPKKEEEVKHDGNNFSPSTVNRKCVVIMEGDPHPGAVKGRMSFQSFNPSIDKLNQEAASLNQPATSASSCGHESAKMYSRENGSSKEEAGCSDVNKRNCGSNGDLKRKRSEKVSEEHCPTKSRKKFEGGEQSTPNSSKGSIKKPKGEKLDWNVLRPSKTPKKRG